MMDIYAGQAQIGIPSLIVMFFSSSFLNLPVKMPDKALQIVLLPWLTWPQQLRLMVGCSRMVSGSKTLAAFCGVAFPSAWIVFGKRVDCPAELTEPLFPTGLLIDFMLIVTFADRNKCLVDVNVEGGAFSSHCYEVLWLRKPFR